MMGKFATILEATPRKAAYHDARAVEHDRVSASQSDRSRYYNHELHSSAKVWHDISANAHRKAAESHRNKSPDKKEHSEKAEWASNKAYETSVEANRRSNRDPD